MKNTELTVIFVAFDGYSDIWDDCIRLYKMFWPDREYKTFFINNTKEVAYDGIEVIHAGPDAEWSKKVQIGLNVAESDYVCILLEDFLVGSTINNALIEETIEYIEKKGIRYYKTVNMSRAGKNRNSKYDNKEYLHVIPESDEYGVSMQAAIWDKVFLRSLIGQGNYNAWKFEFDRVKEAQGKANTPHKGCVFDDRNIFNLQHGIIQGKYLPCTIKYFKNKGIELNVEREIMPYSAYYKYKAISVLKAVLPQKMRGPIKRIMEKMGMKFVSTTRQ